VAPVRAPIRLSAGCRPARTSGKRACPRCPRRGSPRQRWPRRTVSIVRAMNIRIFPPPVAAGMARKGGPASN
jgi:hypothetical protein